MSEFDDDGAQAYAQDDDDLDLDGLDVDDPPECRACGTVCLGKTCTACGAVQKGAAQTQATSKIDEILATPTKFKLNDGQGSAMREIAAWYVKGSEWITLGGAAGTGKTSVLNEAKRLFSDGTMWCAMTGKAATRMKEAAGITAKTLHATLYEPPDSGHAKGLTFNSLRDAEGDTLVIDEASMVTPQIKTDLKKWCKHWGVKVVFVGDFFQLPPVLSKEEEKTFGKGDYSIFAEVPGPRLTQVMRNGDAILDAATLLRTTGQLPVKNTSSYELLRCPDPSGRAIAAYLEDPDDHGLITWTNKTRMRANHAIRAHYQREGLVPLAGEPILVCKNALGGTVLNGEVYVIKEIWPDVDLHTVPTFTIHTVCGKHIHAAGHAFDGTTPYFPEYQDWKAYRREIDMRRIPEPIPITYGYVLTAHKAQGSEYRRVTVFMPKADTSNPHFQAPTTVPGEAKAVPFGRRWIYTAITRARTKLSILMGT